MYRNQVKELSKQLKKTNRAIISIGCSFVQGQGAVNDELYIDYTWTAKELALPLEINATDSEKKAILAKYSNVNKGYEGKLDFTFMEYNNSFVEVLANKYFNSTYTPINFGLRGCGNRASIKELYFHPEFEWSTLDEIIVIYCPSGPERFDFINDTYNDHFRWITMWPRISDDPPNTGREMLWTGYQRHLYSERFAVFEQLAHAQELLHWCKLHNAKLIVTPGFDRRYTKDHFKEALLTNIERDLNTDNVKIQKFYNFLPGSDRKEIAEKFLNLFPWDKMFKPMGSDTFIDLCMAMEKNLEDKNEFFFQFLGKGSPDKWITPCAHPSAKAHDLFAKLLYNQLTSHGS